jgi:hypothetical protein
MSAGDNKALKMINTTDLRDHKCNRPNEKAKIKTTVVKGVLTSYELMLAILFRWHVRSCGHDIVWL